MVPGADGALAAGLLIIFVTHSLGSIAAFGSALLALPLLVCVTHDLPAAVTILAIVGGVQAYHLALFTYRDIAWRTLGGMVLVVGLAMPAGYLARQSLPEQPVLACLGVVLLLSGISGLLPADYVRRLLAAPVSAPLLLLAGGVIHGAFATGGTTLALYARRTFTRKEQFRATLNAFWVVANTAFVGATVRQGHLGPPAVRLMLLALPAVCLANGLATRMVHRLSQERFQRLVSCLLLLAGVLTLVRAL